MNLLQAVNTALPYIGEFPVDSLDATPNPTVQQLLDLINKHLTAICSKGYWFNRRILELKPDIYGSIQLPDRTLNYYVHQRDLLCQGVQTYFLDGNLLANENGRVWKAPLKVHCTMELDFDNLPDVAQQVIIQSATIDLYLQVIGADQTLQTLQQRLVGLQHDLKREDLRHDQVQLGYSSRARFRRFMWR